MEERGFWLRAIETSWNKRSIIWLSGVRRSGKTMLAKSLTARIPNLLHFDCELPSVRNKLQDPETFLESIKNGYIVLDEIHRLANPSEILKIAADHFPKIKILATGSSTLGASKKFKDTLTGRKSNLWLTPMISSDLIDFQYEPDTLVRMTQGGLPPLFLARNADETDYQEWMDSYWAKDIQELFSLEKRFSFLRLAELLAVQSGGLFDASRLARDCEASRPTIQNYLGIMEVTHLAHIIRPFQTRKANEILSIPKVYFFDTGFVTFFRGWRELRPEDEGLLFEHLVLNEIHAHLQTRDISYWRDKDGNEVDFVLTKKGHPPLAIECKLSHPKGILKGMNKFHSLYPNSKKLIVTRTAMNLSTYASDTWSADCVSLESFGAKLLEFKSAH